MICDRFNIKKSKGRLDSGESKRLVRGLAPRRLAPKYGAELQGQLPCLGCRHLAGLANVVRRTRLPTDTVCALVDAEGNHEVVAKK